MPRKVKSAPAKLPKGDSWITKVSGILHKRGMPWCCAHGVSKYEYKRQVANKKRVQNNKKQEACRKIQRYWREPFSTRQLQIGNKRFREELQAYKNNVRRQQAIHRHHSGAPGCWRMTAMPSRSHGLYEPPPRSIKERRRILGLPSKKKGKSAPARI